MTEFLAESYAPGSPRAGAAGIARARRKASQPQARCRRRRVVWATALTDPDDTKKRD